MTSLAVILAAGLGTRLSSITRGRPKGLVAVGGQPILARLLGACETAGLREAIVITGYGREAIEAFVAGLRMPLSIRIVENPSHASAGNAQSLFCAREAIAGRSFLKLDGDLVVPSELVAEMAARADSAIACDRRRPLDAEAMKVRLRGAWVTAIGKDLSQADAESVGLERIDRADVEPLMRELASTAGYYEDAYAALLSRGSRLAVHEVTHPWIEIDDEEDWARAQEMFG